MKSSSLLYSVAVLSHFHTAECREETSRNAAILARLQDENPIAVRKMDADPGAMFFPQYWGFRDGVTSSGQAQMLNASIEDGVMQPPLLPISDDGQGITPSHHQRAIVPRLLFDKRAFTCPAGTSSCSNIGRDDACCPDGLTCNLVSNTGQGDVGCCAGSSCSGQLAGCQDGYTECTAFGGGCCIPGYQCVQGGCIAGATQTIVVHPTPTTSSTPSTTTPSTTSTPPPPPPPSTSSPSSTSTTTSSPPPPSTSSTTATPSAFVPPARPTSAAPSSPSNSTPPPTSGASASACPTGFYQCSAYYNSGACCQVGRDCGLTSCPAPSPSVTVVAGNGVTVVAPAGPGITAVAADRGSCAAGWYACAASVGGDCCPAGFNCGTASCWLNATANAPATGSTPKETPAASSASAGAGAGAVRWGGWRLVGLVFWSLGLGLVGFL